MVVENAFGLLKGRFRRLLKFTEQTDLKSVTNIVASTCVLHNICITMDDLCEDNEADFERVEENMEDSYLDASHDRRQMLLTT